MHIQHLALVNFKNFEEADLKFSSNLNCFIGNNGAGKTNLMDAIYYLSFCKSFSSAIDGLNIRHEEEFFVVQGKYQRLEQDEHIYCGLKRGQKKHFKRNKKEYKKLSEHIGLLPLIIITPSDINLIMGGSDERRRFLDGLISQYDQVYLDNLIRYNRALLQRNKLLKQFASERFFSEESLEVWSDQLVHYGQLIHEKRVEYLQKLQPIFQQYYELISSGKERIEMIHESKLNENDLGSLLKESIAKDRILQYTSVGIHKDDILFNLGDYPIKKLGSQGQKKTYLVALKLAQFDFIKELSGMTPILLLDDIFDKLDKNRVEQIVKLVANDHFGQIFITDTNREHLDQIITEIEADYKIFQVVEGSVNEDIK
ncbi:DNA replication/repair protein RecF [Sunxiuqinia elliptica]|uniref:DNA replication and repair protein RecF n=1 Tax=Sunxiuqinia elliptica TaxID=655355 RepID=A0A1I2K0P5_9BACT|nr:DNA replication/repair protein RecF [Sunxiuqinia elliptica]TDN95826.1 DNA replication and repair protein RecF [Sunxiuqinia elliptica]TDO67768.1 DNA replication and repair protein RecF [Sunxiuqinia elliptica]SFF59959.1 DNA replication and repair protein RecF [Sunxiuqinia elliptica]